MLPSIFEILICYLEITIISECYRYILGVLLQYAFAERIAVKAIWKLLLTVFEQIYLSMLERLPSKQLMK